MEDELVDLSLFAVSPTDDRHFVVNNLPSPPWYNLPRQENYVRPLEYSRSFPENRTMKPLPPLPRRRLCGRGQSAEPESNHRCIINRIRSPRSDDDRLDHGHTIQQRRNANSPPQLTLSVPQAPRETRSRSSPPSPMTWLPDEQMWLVSDEAREYANNREAYQPPPPAYTRHSYARSEPPPRQYFHYDLTPPLTPVQNQFRSLMEQRDQEASSPLVEDPLQGQSRQQMTDISGSFFLPSPSYEVERDRRCVSSGPVSAVEHDRRSEDSGPSRDISMVERVSRPVSSGHYREPSLGERKSLSEDSVHSRNLSIVSSIGVYDQSAESIVSMPSASLSPAESQYNWDCMAATLGRSASAMG